MKQHEFLMEPGVWLGEGTIQFSSQDLEELKFFTRWQISLAPSGSIMASQEIELAGGSDKTINIFELSNIKQEKFAIELENELFGRIIGKGLFSKESIAWEFHGTGSEFEGFEVYQRQKDGTYLTRAEYSSFNEPHTVITGSLWKKKSGKEDHR